jgi:hypothetical protein
MYLLFARFFKLKLKIEKDIENQKWFIENVNT